MNNKIIAAIALVVLVAGGWYVVTKGHSAAGIGAAVNESQSVATVNGESITRAMYDKTTTQLAAQAGVNIASTTDAQKAQLKGQVLDSLVAQVLLRQAAEKAGVTASTTGVDIQIQAIKTQVGSDDAYQKALADEGMTESDLRAQISSDIMIREYLDQKLNLSNVAVSDAEIKAAYDTAAATQKVPPLKDVQAQVKQMVLGQKQQALIAEEVKTLRAAADVKILI